MQRYALRLHTYTCTQPMLLQTNLSRHSKIWGGISFPRWNLQSATHTNNTYHQHNFNHSLQAKHAPHKLSHKQKYHLDIINWYASTPFSNSYTQKQSNYSSMQFTTTTEHYLFYPVMRITNVDTNTSQIPRAQIVLHYLRGTCNGANTEATYVLQVLLCANSGLWINPRPQASHWVTDGQSHCSVYTQMAQLLPPQHTRTHTNTHTLVKNTESWSKIHCQRQA